MYCESFATTSGRELGLLHSGACSTRCTQTFNEDRCRAPDRFWPASITNDFTDAFGHDGREFHSDCGPTLQCAGSAEEPVNGWMADGKCVLGTPQPTPEPQPPSESGAQPTLSEPEQEPEARRQEVIRATHG